MLLETILIPVSGLLTNSGEIEGLPANPRLIKDGKFRKLMQSIKDDPEMLSLRELIVYPFKKSFVVIGGNMRLKACIELGYKEVPCKVLNPKVSVDTLKGILIKDNVSYGETDWDLVANDWNTDDLEYWGMDLPKDWGKEIAEEEIGTVPSKPVVKMEILFDDLDYYQHCKERLTEFLKDYPGIEIVEPKGVGINN